MKKRFIHLLVVAALLLPVALCAQEATQDPDTGEPEELLTEGEPLYRHVGDRDPFTPLVRMTGGKQDGGQVKVKYKESGIGRFTVEACNLEAIITTSEGTAAWFQGPDNKAYKVLVGDEFADGRVMSVSLDDGLVVVRQELVHDVTQVKPFRDLPLSIRSQGGQGR